MVEVEWQTLRVPENVTYRVFLTDRVCNNTDTDHCRARASPQSGGAKRRQELCHKSYDQGQANGSCEGEAPEAFWEYGVEVEATTRWGTSRPNDSQTTLTTHRSNPGVVSSLNWWTKHNSSFDSGRCGADKMNDYYKLCIQWMDVCPRHRNSFIETYVYSLEGGNQTIERKVKSRFVDQRLNDSQCPIDVEVKPYNVRFNVTPGETYTVTVFAVGRRDLKGKNLTVNASIPEVQPPSLSSNLEREVVEKSKIRPNSTTIQFSLKNSSFLPHNNNSSSRVTTRHGVIVTSAGDAPRSYHAMEDFDNYPRWKNGTQALQKGGYRIKEEELEAPQDGPLTVIIGDKLCDHDHQHPDDFCDGPLNEGTSYSVWVFVCNEQDCASTVLVSNVTTTTTGQDEDMSWDITRAVVAGVSVSLFLLACIFAVWYFFFRNKKSKVQMADPQELSDWNTVLGKIKEPRTQRPMKLVTLENIICKKQRDDGLLLRDEYEDIVQSHTDANTGRYKHPRPHYTGGMEINRPKNRYNDIVTYDHSRVKLTKDKDSSDFINANFIPGYQSDKDFIATQGPLPFTTNDFWRMVWEHNVSNVVMLTLPKEAGKIKCEQYWPAQRGEMSEYEDIRVTNTSVSTVNDYNITIFSLSNCKTQERAREVRHFHYLKWRDMTAEVEVDSILEFHRVVRQHIHPDKPGPVVVHCSAGVGRTGAFIALDYIYHAIAQRAMKEELDIYGLVMRMRQFRCNMIQTSDQYLFIHQCARVLMASRRKREAEEGVGRVSYAPSTSSLTSDTSPQLPRTKILMDPRPESKVKFAATHESRDSPYKPGIRGDTVGVGGTTPASSTEHLFIP